MKKRNLAIVMLSIVFLLLYSRTAFAASYKVKAVTPYNAVVTVSKLYIRSIPASKGRVTGYYYKGNIITITGISGSYLRTSRGYVLSSYVKKYVPPVKYISISMDTPLYLNTSGTADERYAVKGKTFTVLGKVGSFYKVKLGKITGYVPVNHTAVRTTIKDKITMGWIYINGKDYNSRYYDGDDYINKSSYATGLDVVSPTWFDMSGDAADKTTIDINDKADAGFTKAAHANGYEVWARLCESNPQRANIVFTDSSVKARILDKIVNLAVTYNVDGVNIDFEGLGQQNTNGFTLFVRDLSAKLKACGITVSVDVTKPANSSYNFYDRASLVKYSDYLILMAYDEHTASLTSAGSNASYAWVEGAVKATLASGVPSSKLILGVPFYFRDYIYLDVNNPYVSVSLTNKGDMYSEPVLDDTEKVDGIGYGSYKYISTQDNFYVVDYNGQNEYIPVSDGTIVPANTPKSFIVGTATVNITDFTDIKSNNTVTEKYDSVTKQFIAEYTKDGLRHRMWVEDKSSMGWKMDFINSYKLKGAAAWQLYKETPDILQLIKTKLK